VFPNERINNLIKVISGRYPIFPFARNLYYWIFTMHIPSPFLLSSFKPTQPNKICEVEVLVNIDYYFKCHKRFYKRFPKGEQDSYNQHLLFVLRRVD